MSEEELKREVISVKNLAYYMLELIKRIETLERRQKEIRDWLDSWSDVF